MCLRNRICMGVLFYELGHAFYWMENCSDVILSFDIHVDGEVVQKLIIPPNRLFKIDAKKKRIFIDFFLFFGIQEIMKCMVKRLI